ncbi:MULTISPECIES: restriction endonuclease subunit S [Pasteurellaceae]|uniref:Restriction endonuclease subunit S n=1 Tax=Pasteurella atlantica TaxID=2827233 RepID=A0AAW8CIN6_9PAST|nr:restriction endonuclease subunit S [Pasteurella atlantica]MDP8039891.1 restriction endonuclease subunit S [Pasteurella atlantica]MDP8042085.1 restriction endonuclease subunit S [Pasteurella atlantica]MDP8046284.1 restriction endonuclease subunit S [Pasteurella atlantica]MDP8062160.1 restriction endonuclease subunit S [Pasteurella atlantica]MDP8089800.1 restriction endonuclease subunit S [Pasteurella atlantica]
MLESVEWGEFRIGDLFEIKSYKKRFDANKVTLLETGYPYIVRTALNNGLKGYINEDKQYLNDGNTISFGQDTATMFYQEKPYFTGDKIKILKSKYDEFSKNNAQFFISVMGKAFSCFSWGSSSFNVSIISEQKITLPITSNGLINFSFMEKFIAELEASHLAELEAYLSVTNLKDYHLTEEEKDVLRSFEQNEIKWGEFKYRDIFNNIKQGRRLKKDDQLDGNIPFVMSGITNTGVVNYISNPISIFPENSITIDIFGNTFYRSFSYGAGDDTGAYWNDKKDYVKEEMLFFATSMARSLSGKFSYGKKLRSSQSLNFKMKLPLLNNEPNYQIMEIFIKAIQKLVIKDVVLYSEQKRALTKQVISS